MDLKELGWNDFHEKQYEETKAAGTFPARVTKAQREKYWLCSAYGELRAEIRGKLRFTAGSIGDLPVVGDWVTAEMRPEGDAAVITDVLPRVNKFSRKTAGSVTDEQVLVANINVVFIVMGLDGDYNVRRIERYLALARESGAKPVIVLNKADACPRAQDNTGEIESIAAGVPVITMSALKNEGVEKLREYIFRGTTVAFLGSSGAGKSTIINRLLGEEKLEVGAVRTRDDRGKHTTTRRELLLLPGGGVVIDNPGMRELQLWVQEGTLDNTFRDVKDFASRCRFRDCTHTNEPGCAVNNAIEQGDMDIERLRSYNKLKRELRYLATRKEAKARNEKMIFEKKISRIVKQIKKHGKRGGF